MSASHETSHDIPRATGARARDLRARPERVNGKPAPRRSRAYRAAFEAALAAQRRAQAGADGEEARELARHTLQLARGAQRELQAHGAARGPSVLAHVLGFAQAHVIAQRLGVLAIAAGLGTEKGLALLAESQRAQSRSARCWVAAAAAGGLLRGRAPDPGATRAAPWLLPPDDDDDEAKP